MAVAEGLIVKHAPSLAPILAIGSAGIGALALANIAMSKNDVSKDSESKLTPVQSKFEELISQHTPVLLPVFGLFKKSSTKSDPVAIQEKEVQEVEQEVQVESVEQVGQEMQEEQVEQVEQGEQEVQVEQVQVPIIQITEAPALVDLVEVLPLLSPEATVVSSDKIAKEKVFNAEEYVNTIMGSSSLRTTAGIPGSPLIQSTLPDKEVIGSRVESMKAQAKSLPSVMPLKEKSGVSSTMGESITTLFAEDKNVDGPGSPDKSMKSKIGGMFKSSDPSKKGIWASVLHIHPT